LSDNRKVLSLDVGKLTDPGKIRHHLVDSLGFYKPDDPELLYSKGEMFLVADGIGGHEAGAQAARLATDLIIKTYFDKSTDASIEACLKHAFNLANMRIIEQNQENSGPIQAGTSVTCAVIQRGTLHVAHIGNSRIYLIKGNKIKQLTHDHLLREDANLSPDLRRTGAKIRISRALGWVPGVEIDYFPQSLKPNDCLLLCTDGLFQLLDNQEIGRIALKYAPQAACEKLISIANEKGGTDNITNILIKINGLITISESFAQNFDTGINLILPAADQPAPPTAHRPGATFRIGGSPQVFPPEESRPIEPEEPPLWELDDEPDEVTGPEPSNFEEAPFPDPVRKEPLPRIPTPRPLPFERRDEPSPERKFAPAHPASFGMRRRRNEALPVKSVDYPRLIKSGFFILLAVIIVVSAIYLLLSEIKVKSPAPVTQSDAPHIQLLPDSVYRESVSEVDVPPANLEINAGAGKAVADLTGPLEVVLWNGNTLARNTVQQLIAALKSPELESTQFKTQPIPTSVGSRSKILYRYPENGNALPIRTVAQKIKQTIQARYKKDLEITHCDITLILGKDLRMSGLKTQDLRRRVLDSNQLTPIHVEILNGSGRAGFGDRFKGDLNDLLIDEKQYLKIIDVRNAASFDYANTMIKCRTSKVAVASKIADILGLPANARSIETRNLEDIQLVLGRDFD